MAQHREDGDWRFIAEQVSKEMDPAKLTMLVAKLCRALDSECTEKPQSQRHPANELRSFLAD
jgi:hypothetical protein